MNTEWQPHPFQSSILRELLFSPGSRFRDLKKVDVTNDHFSFHVKKLLEEGLIRKEGQKYFLSDKGKEFANRMDTESLQIEKQAKVAVAIHVVRQQDDKKQYLYHQRLKEPFYGWYGSVSGKIRWGENPLDAAKRELMEETGLTGKFTHCGVVHYHHVHKDGRYLEDKYFFVFKVEDSKGKFLETVPEGKNHWFTEEQVRPLKEVFSDFDEMIEVIDSPQFVYLDRRAVVESY